MLSIFVYGNLFSGFLDLAPGTSLDMEIFAPAFDEELNTGEFSLPSDIEWTDNNRKLLGHAEMVNGFRKENNYWRADVYDRMVPELVNAKLTMLEKAGSLRFMKGKFSSSISGSKGLYGSLIKNKKLADLALGGKITWTGMDSREFAYDLMDGNQPAYNYLTFCPVAIEQFINEQRADYDGEFLTQDTVNNVVIESGAWTFGRPTTADPNVTAASGTEEYIDYRTIPFFKLKYLVRKCFEEFGFIVKGDFIDDAWWNDVTVFNNYAIEQYDTTLYTDKNRSITPANHVPDLLISDFLKYIFWFFGVKAEYSAATVTLTYKKKALKNKQVGVLDGFVLDQFQSVYQEGDATKGYTINYQWDSEDSYYNDRVKDLSEKILCATVNTYSNLATLDIGRSFTTNDIVLVEAENLYYVVADATGPIVWDIWAERLQEYKEGEGELPKNYPISTLCTYVLFNEGTGLYERKNFVGCRQGGTYHNNKGGLVKKEFGLRLFYSKFITVSGISRPASFNHSRAVNNSQLETYSLAWLGPDGMAVNFHTDWQNLQQNREIVKLDIVANQKTLQLVNSSSILQWESVQFMLYKIERSIPLQSSMRLWLVPL